MSINFTTTNQLRPQLRKSLLKLTRAIAERQNAGACLHILKDHVQVIGDYFRAEDGMWSHLMDTIRATDRNERAEDVWLRRQLDGLGDGTGEGSPPDAHS